MLRGLLAAAVLVPACAAHAPAEPKAPSPAGHPDLALSAILAAYPEPADAVARRPRRVGRLSPPFAVGAPARNVLARASSGASERDLASR